MAKRRPRKEPGRRGVSFAEVVKLAREVEGAERGTEASRGARMRTVLEESTSYGTPALKVRGKLLVRLKEDGQTLVLMTTFEDRERLLAAAPEVFFLTEHYRNYPAVLVRLPLVEREVLRELLAEAWRIVGGE